jgi:acetolactate decarboxylase
VLGAHDGPLVLVAVVGHGPVRLPPVGVDGRSRLHRALDERDQALLGDIVDALQSNLGLGTLNGLDGELIVIDGQAWKANRDCRLIRAPGSSRTPYAVVVPFSPGPPVTLRGPLQYAALGKAVGHRLEATIRPVAVRIDGRFEHVRVRSVPRQRRPYPQLAEALAQQRISDLHDVPGTMVGFGFPDALDGIER